MERMKEGRKKEGMQEGGMSEGKKEEGLSRGRKERGRKEGKKEEKKAGRNGQMNESTKQSTKKQPWEKMANIADSQPTSTIL